MPFEPLPDSLAAHFGKHARFACSVRWAGVFLDLLWPPTPPPLEHCEYAKRDPAFVVEGFCRYVALASVGGELRYFASGLESHLRATGIVSGPRFEAALREGDAYEMGELLSREDVVDFVDSYLRGVEPNDIPIARRISQRRTLPP